MRPMMIARMLPWIGGVATLLLALVFRSPLFLPWRAIAMVWLSTATCIVVGGFIARLRRRHQRLSGGAILTNHCPNPKYRQFTLVKEAAE